MVSKDGTFKEDLVKGLVTIDDSTGRVKRDVIATIKDRKSSKHLEGVVIEVFIEKDKPFHVQGLPKDITLMVWNYDALVDKKLALKTIWTHEGEVK